MTQQALENKLHELLALIRSERECAKRIAIPDLLDAAERKRAVLAQLGDLEQLDINDDIRQLAQTVRQENRRNAFLFWNTLHWLRDLMALFDQKTAPHTYGNTAGLISGRTSGRLLSGRI